MDYTNNSLDFSNLLTDCGVDVIMTRFRFSNREELEAIRRYQKGEKLCFSTGIADDEITYGYGKLDNNGYWEFPLPYIYLNSKDKLIVDESEGVN